MTQNFLSSSEEETKEIAQKLAQNLQGGEVVALSGDLGSGKTVFVKGLAEGLGIQDIVTSPTFVLMKLYAVPKTFRNLKGTRHDIQHLLHVDTYRLTIPQELIDIGLLDYLGKQDTVVAIEWPEKISLILKDRTVIYIKIVHREESKRQIEITQHKTRRTSPSISTVSSKKRV